MQEDALKSAGCEEIFTDVVSGLKSQRLGEQKNTVAEICKIYDISRPSFYNYINKRKLALTVK